MARRPSVCAALLCLLLAACGGGGGGGGSTPAPTPTPNPAPGGTNPCAGISITTALRTDGAASRKRLVVDGDARYNVLDALALSRARRISSASMRAEAGPAAAADVGEIAVLQDEGDIIAPPNPFDLRGAGVRFTRNGAGGYDARSIDGAFRTTLGRQLTLTDDDSTEAASAFALPFYGASYPGAFVNSDGNVTFGEEDRSSTERNIARLLTGPPRIAAFLTDLDPSAGGRVFVNAASDAYTVTWCNVRGFDSTRVIATQLSVLGDGTIEVKYGTSLSGLSDAVVGVSPGRTGEFTPADLSGSGADGGAAAVGERFATQPQLDTVALLRKFYETHPDNYDQVVIWTDAPVIQNAFAFESTVANEIRGIGVSVFDASRDFGSAGRLRSLAVMDWIGKYPQDPTQRFLGENSTLSVLGQEVGHRWLAFMDFRDHTGARSDQLLGRGDSHWSFFYDSDASVMEGNDIEDLGGGAFRTVDAVRRYSLLDQYAMGLVPEAEVPPSFYVQSPTNMSSNRTRESAPQTGITFNGTRRDVLIQDIVAVNGPRVPSAAESPRVHRQAFVFLSSAGRTPDPDAIARVDRIRLEWEGFFSAATDGRMRAITTLR